MPVRVWIVIWTGMPRIFAGSIGSTRLSTFEIVLVLPSVLIEPLTEIALVVVEADRDERDAQIGRAFYVIAGEDAEAARIDRNRFVKAEFRREIRHRPRPQHAGVAGAPGVGRIQYSFIRR